MEPTLNPGEIDALRGKARRKTSAVRPAAEAPPAAAFDPRQLGQPSAAQFEGLEGVHKACAQNIASRLSTLLRVAVEAEAAPARQVSGAEFLEKLPEAAYLASLGGTPGTTAFLQIDLSLVFPILDRVLGGTGEDSTEARDLTEIEREIFEPVMRGLALALREGWEPLLILDGPAQHVARSEAAALLPPADNMLVVAFQLRLQETQGQLLLAFPAAVSSALLRKFAPPPPLTQLRPSKDSSRLREQLLACRFEGELLLPPSTVSIRQLCGLKPGDVLVLKVRSNEPLPVHIAGREMFLASPVRCASRRGAQVQKVLSIVPRKEGEEKP